ncbi:uncharacterized protein LOC116095097 [Mastomys coucha]|uniref:uncharacterized protein LOC116095097 n=1 Tax=Mastomys coucha TaxID=35658 RepID=UPI0012618C2B|nr:uncharacterized protein LOC116095097 [Mastomys coucha]
MDHLTLDTRRFLCIPALTLYLFNIILKFNSWKEFIYKLSGLLISLSVFVFEILIASSLCWRLWEFDNNVVQFVSFGLWEVYYSQHVNISGTLTTILVHTPIDSTWNISTEFLYAQNLMVWAILMMPLVLVFSAMAIKISCKKHPFVEMQIYCYKISSLILSVSSVFTFVSVTWNHYVDLYGQTTLDFPPDFPVKKEALQSKHLTAVLPLGLLLSIMSLFGVMMFVSEISYLKLQSSVKANCASKTALIKI